MTTKEALEYTVGQVYDLPLSALRANPAQPRRNFEREPLEALKLSIAREGLLQPIAAVRTEDGVFVIAAGERRYRAVTELGWKTVPTRIVDGNLDDLVIMENMIREDLNPMERAIAMETYLTQHKLSRKKLSTILGMARNSISEILSLNRLPKDIQETIIKDKRYSLHNMRIIARIRDPEVQRAKFERLRAKIEKLALPASETSAKFRPAAKKDRLVKMTKEVKRLQVSYTKQELKELRGEIRSLYEQLQALLYKIGDSVTIDD